MADKTIRTVIQLRRDTTANWTLHGDVVPAEGEPCLDLDTGLVKYGDGVTAYKDLAYPSGGVATPSFQVVDSVPDASDAQDGVFYLVMNAETSHYDIYIKTGDTMTKIGDTTVDVSNKVDKEEGKRLMSDEEGDKLAGIAEGAEVNVIDVININGTALTVTDKAVDIPGATATALGLVKGSDAEDGVTVNDDFTMTVNSLNVNKLVQTDGDRLILNGGSAAD